MMKKAFAMSLLFFLVSCTVQPMLWFPVEPIPAASVPIEETEPYEPVEEVYPLPEKPGTESAVAEVETEEIAAIENIEEKAVTEEIIEEVALVAVEERKPMVSLTFDDGPSRYTDRILDLLEEHGGQATFFVLGYRVENHRDTVQRAWELGNEIASHSWSHARLAQLSPEAIIQDLQSTSDAIRSVTGYSPPIMRPPFGQTSEVVRNATEELGYAIVNWNLDTLDWRYRDADKIYNTIMNEVEDGSFTVLHDIHTTTAAAMEKVIPSLISKGYQLVTVSELLAYFYGELEPGRIYGRQFDIDKEEQTQID